MDALSTIWDAFYSQIVNIPTDNALAYVYIVANLVFDLILTFMGYTSDTISNMFGSIF
ncbi:MAG TPA: hypothetical protein PLI09_27695 [Candidatus Hydrogenedentes bacterium]|nr:hypothetical protein [Candidatus Hydrogenedentota bacterium]